MILAKLRGKLGSLKNYLGLALSVRATISDSKADFHKEFPFVIPPIYRKLVDELIVELHLLSHQKNFKQDSIFAIGLIEIFSKFTYGYKPSEHINKLFNAICNCNNFNPVDINIYAEELKKVSSISKDDLSEFINKLSNNNKDMDYYSRINAIGIYKIVSELSYCNGLKEEELQKEINKISQLLGYQFARVDKDISLYKSNIEKMKQALEIISQNISSK